MNGPELIRIIEAMHREKNIPKEVIFNGLESAIHLAAQRGAIEDDDVLVHIDRGTGQIIAQRGDMSIDPVELGRIAAQSAKQVMIQKIREAESEGVYTEFTTRKGELVIGTVQRVDQGNNCIVTLSKDGNKTGGGSTVEALLPRSEQIPGETHHVNDRIKTVVMEVRRNGHRVKIVLSRNHPDFVRCLFEQEIPEIQEGTIAIKAVAREAGYRSKVAVSSIDMKVDCVGACVGVRGSRIKNVIDELNGERIDIVRWNDSMQVMIPNALQPAEISEVMLYERLGRVVVLVTEDQLSLAIGRRGQNVRLASKLVGWDIEIMTHDELGEAVAKSERWFSRIPTMTPEIMEVCITEGFLSFTDLTFLEPATLAEMTGITEDEAEEIIIRAEEEAEKIERDGDPEEEAIEAAAAEAAAAEEAAAEAAAAAASAEADQAIAVAVEGEGGPAPDAGGPEIHTNNTAMLPAEGEPIPTVVTVESFHNLFRPEEPEASAAEGPAEKPE